MFISLIFHDLLFEKSPQQPPGRLIYLKFRHNASNRHKRKVRNFGDFRQKGSRVLAASRSDGAGQKAPPPRWQHAKIHFLKCEVSLYSTYRAIFQKLLKARKSKIKMGKIKQSAITGNEMSV